MGDQQHLVVFPIVPNPNCNFWFMNQHTVAPPMSEQLRRFGVSDADFIALTKLSDDSNRAGDRCVPWTLLTFATCGALGWCCLIYDSYALKKAAQDEIDTFNKKYNKIGVSVALTNGGLMFNKRKPEKKPVVTL